MEILCEQQTVPLPWASTANFLTYSKTKGWFIKATNINRSFGLSTFQTLINCGLLSLGFTYSYIEYYLEKFRFVIYQREYWNKILKEFNVSYLNVCVCIHIHTFIYMYGYICISEEYQMIVL